MMNKTLKPLASFCVFILLTYGISWVFWIPAVFLKEDLLSFPTILLHTLGGFGPSLAGILMIYRTRGRAGRRDFWRRTIDFRQIGIGWVLVILAVFPLLTLASTILANLVGAPAHPFTTVQRVAAQPVLLVVMLLAGLIGGPVSEELGWRGFALDALQTRWGALPASILLGFFWGVWHLPLFFIAGTPQYLMGVGTLAFWLFMLNPIPLSMLFTWVYNRTNGSILSAILMHLGFNFNANLLYPLSPQASVIQAMLLMLAMVLAVFLPYRKKSSEIVNRQVIAES